MYHSISCPVRHTDGLSWWFSGMFFESREEFLAAIHDIMATIPTKTLYGVCEH
jgi:hypothetical protein